MLSLQLEMLRAENKRLKDKVRASTPSDGGGPSASGGKRDGDRTRQLEQEMAALRAEVQSLAAGKKVRERRHERDRDNTCCQGGGW